MFCREMDSDSNAPCFLLAGKLQGSLKAESNVGASDQGKAAGSLSHGINGPTCHRSAANPVVFSNPCRPLNSFL